MLSSFSDSAQVSILYIISALLGSMQVCFLNVLATISFFGVYFSSPPLPRGPVSSVQLLTIGHSFKDLTEMQTPD